MHAVTRLLGLAADRRGPEVRARAPGGRGARVLRRHPRRAARGGRRRGPWPSRGGEPRRWRAREGRWRSRVAHRWPTTRRGRVGRWPARRRAARPSALGGAGRRGNVLLLPMRSSEAVRHVLVLADERRQALRRARRWRWPASFAAAASAALAQLAWPRSTPRRWRSQAALARAAKTLNESLDLNRVLARICHEAASILDADNAVVYRGSAEDGRGGGGRLRHAPRGDRLPDASRARAWPAGSPSSTGRCITNDYQGCRACRTRRCSARSAAALAVPMHWDGELRGVLAVGYTRPYLRHPRAPQPARGLRRAGRGRVPQRQRARRPGAGRAHGRPHRLPQPRGDAGRAATRDRALRAHRPPPLAGAGRHGRLQAGERGATATWRATRCCGGVGRALRQARSPLRPGRPLRGRRVRDRRDRSRTRPRRPRWSPGARCEGVTRALDESWSDATASGGGASAGVAEWAPGESPDQR